jgi:hypothetical protein
LRALIALAGSVAIRTRRESHGGVDRNGDGEPVTSQRGCDARLRVRRRFVARPALFSIGGTSFADAINGEAVASQVIAALVGSIGRIASMPITTALAALLALRMSDRQLDGAHAAHAH